jgi:hypothetical protein
MPNMHSQSERRRNSKKTSLRLFTNVAHPLPVGEQLDPRSPRRGIIDKPPLDDFFISKTNSVEPNQQEIENTIKHFKNT